MNWDGILQILTGCLGTLAFGILFNIRGKKLLLASLGGIFSWGLFLLLGFVFDSEVLRYFLVSAAISGYAELLARKVKTPATTFSVVSLVSLIPGGSLYYAMSHFIEGDLDVFVPKALYTLELAAALSLGILLVTAAIRTVNRFRMK